MDFPKIHESEYRFCLIMWEHIEYLADILAVGNLEDRVSVVDELMKEGKIAFLQEYTARKKKEVAHHGEEPENA